MRCGYSCIHLRFAVPHKMAASEESCDGNPNFAVICSFINKFGDDCGVNISIPYLQQMLEDTKNVNEDLSELLIHLLRRGRKRVTKERWEKCLIKFCHEYSTVDAWEIERFGFTKAKLSVKLEILKRLLELQFDANAKFKAEVNKLEASSLRLLPLGKDIDGQAYWYQLDKEYNIRLYRETLGEEESTWQLLCSNTEDLRNLLTSLEKKYSTTSKDSCEDKSNDSNNPKSPTSDMLPVPKKERDTEDLTSHLSESKPCTIIIKTEKRETVSHSEVPDCVKNENCAIETDKKAIGCELENSTKGSVKLKLKLEPSIHSRTEHKSSERAVVECSAVIEKASVVELDAEPMEVETSKVTSSDEDKQSKTVPVSDVEMEEEENVLADKVRSESEREEQSDQNFSTTAITTTTTTTTTTTVNSTTSSSVVTEHSDSANHHKSSKIRLYEKWSSEKKMLDTSKQNVEECNIDSKTSSIVVDKDESVSGTLNQKNDPAIPLSKPSEQSSSSEFINKQTDLAEHNKTAELETAVDLSKASRVNVIVQNMCSKPILSNGVSSILKSNSGKTEKDSAINSNSSNLETNKKSDASSVSFEKSQSSTFERKYKSFESESKEAHKRNQSYSDCYDTSVITKTSSVPGFSHLQALQNMCESNQMGGIPSVIQSTNRHNIENNRTAFFENKITANCDNRFENMSRRYNFNDVHCSNDKILPGGSEATNMMLKSNLHKREDERDKKMELISSEYQGKSKPSSFNVSNEQESFQEIPTDLSCSDPRKSDKWDSNKSEIRNKTSSSTINKKDTWPTKDVGMDLTEKKNTKLPDKTCDLSKKSDVYAVNKSDSIENKSVNLCSTAAENSLLDSSVKDKGSPSEVTHVKELCSEKTVANSTKSAIKSYKIGDLVADVSYKHTDVQKSKKDRLERAISVVESLNRLNKNTELKDISEPVDKSIESGDKCKDKILISGREQTNSSSAVLKESENEQLNELKEKMEEKSKILSDTPSSLAANSSIKANSEIQGENEKEEKNELSVKSLSACASKVLKDTDNAKQEHAVKTHKLLSKLTENSLEKDKHSEPIIFEMGENKCSNEALHSDEGKTVKSGNKLDLSVNKKVGNDILNKSSHEDSSNVSNKVQPSELNISSNKTREEEKNTESFLEKETNRGIKTKKDLDKPSEGKMDLEKTTESKTDFVKAPVCKTIVEKTSESKIDVEKVPENELNTKEIPEERIDVKKISENERDRKQVAQSKMTLEKVSENKIDMEKLSGNEVELKKEVESKTNMCKKSSGKESEKEIDIEKVIESKRDVKIEKASEDKKYSPKASENELVAEKMSECKKDVVRISQNDMDALDVSGNKKDGIKVPEDGGVKRLPGNEKNVENISKSKNVEEVSEQKNTEVISNKTNICAVTEQEKNMEVVTEQEKLMEVITDQEKDMEVDTEQKKKMKAASEQEKNMEVVTEQEKNMEAVIDQEKNMEVVIEQEKNMEIVTEQEKNTEAVTKLEKKIEEVTKQEKYTTVISEQKNTEEVSEKETNAEVVSKQEKNTEVVSKEKNAEVVSKQETTEVSEQEDNTEISKHVKNIKVVSKENTKVSKQEKNTEVSKQEKNTEVSKEEKKSAEVSKEEKITEVSKQEKITEVSKQKKSTEVSTQEKNIEISKQEKNSEVSKQDKSRKVSKQAITQVSMQEKNAKVPKEKNTEVSKQEKIMEVLDQEKDSKVSKKERKSESEKNKKLEVSEEEKNLLVSEQEKTSELSELKKNSEVTEQEKNIERTFEHKKIAEIVPEQVKDTEYSTKKKEKVDKVSNEEKNVDSKRDVENISVEGKNTEKVTKKENDAEKLTKKDKDREKISKIEINREKGSKERAGREKMSKKESEKLLAIETDVEKMTENQIGVEKVSKKHKETRKEHANKNSTKKISENKLDSKPSDVEITEKPTENEQLTEKKSEKESTNTLEQNKSKLSLDDSETFEETDKFDHKSSSQKGKGVGSKSDKHNKGSATSINTHKEKCNEKEDSDKNENISPKDDALVKFKSKSSDKIVEKPMEIDTDFSDKDEKLYSSKIESDEKLGKNDDGNFEEASERNLKEPQNSDLSVEGVSKSLENKPDEKNESSTNVKDIEMSDICSSKTLNELPEAETCEKSDAEEDAPNEVKRGKTAKPKKGKGRSRRKTSFTIRKNRRQKDRHFKVPDLETNSETVSSAKIEESGELSVSASIKSGVSKEIDDGSDVLKSNALYEERLKVYNLRHSICLEAKFKHPFCDKYLRKSIEGKNSHILSECTIDLTNDENLLVNFNEESPANTKTRARGRNSRTPVNKKPESVSTPAAKSASEIKKTPASNARKRQSRYRKKEDPEKDDFGIPEGFLEILGNADKAASDKGAPGKKRKGSEIKDTSASQQNSENESAPIKRSRRIQEQHQKKMTELAVEMEREQRILEQLAKRSNNAKRNVQSGSPKLTPKSSVKGSNAKGSGTPTKSPKARTKIQALAAEEETCMESRRATRKMNSRSKNLTRMTLMYEDESKDSQFSTSRETEKSKRRRRGRGQRKGFRPWDVSSESESSIEELTEEEEEEPDEPLIFDVNEDEFACEEVDPNAEPVIIRRARTAKKTEVESTAEECINDDTPCQKCGKYDKPEWILLCDKCDSGYHTHCLIPPLMIVPDGDWFCQPCEHMSLCQCLQEELNKLEVVLKQREREELRKQRLAYVGISLDNVLKPEKKEKSDESERDEAVEEKEEVKKKEDYKRHKVKEPEDDERHQKLYGKRSVRARRNVNYQFKEYDALIASALQEEMLEIPEEDFKEEEDGSEAGSDKPFTAKISKRKKRVRRWRDLDFSDEEDDSEDEYQGGSTDSEATQPPSSKSEEESGSGEWKISKSKKKPQRKPPKPRRKRRGGDSSEEDWEDEVAESEAYRPTTRRAAQKAISYRELSSDEEEEWGAKPQETKKRRKARSSSESEASFKKKPSKKKRICKWASSDSSESEEEKSMSSSEGEESEEEASQEEESEKEWKIDQKEKILRLKSNTNKKVLSSEEDEEESSTRDSVPKKQPKKVISDESEEEEDEEEEEEEEEEESESEESEEEDEDEVKEKKTEKKPTVPEKIVPSVPTKKITLINNDKPDSEKKGIPTEKTESISEKKSSMDRHDSLSITENREFQPKVLVKKELCSVDIPLEPLKQTVPVTSVVDKIPPKTVRKDTTKMVPCVIPYDKSPKSGHASNPEEESDKETSREEELPHRVPLPSLPPPPPRPAHFPKHGTTFPPPSSRIQFGGVLARHSIPPLSSSVRPPLPLPVPPGNVPPRMLAPTNLSTRPSKSPSVVVRHTASPSNLSVRPSIPSSNVPVPPSTSSAAAPAAKNVHTKSENKSYKSTIMEPFSNMEDENDSDDEVPLERIPNACVPAPLPNRPVAYEREAEYRPAAKELSSYSFAPPEEKPFPGGSYSPLAPFQDYSARPSPLKPSLVETYPNNSSPSKLTPLDTYSQPSSPKGFISLDSYSENRKKKHFYGNTSSEAEPANRPAASSSENYQGGEIRFPPEPYPCPQSPNTYPANRSPSPSQRDPGTPPRLYSQFPDAYAPPRSPEYYQNHQYYASEERIPRPSYQPNYAPPEPSFVANPYVATPVPQPNGGFMIDTLLRARNHENEEDELTGVTDIVSYITQE